MAETRAPQQRGRPFPKGRSGNPSGRPKGSRHEALRVLDAVGEQAAQELLQAVVAKAMSGDMQAARILLDRVWPARKGRVITFDLPATTTAVGVAQAIAGILEATASGHLTIEEGQGLTAILETQRRTLELTTIEERLTALENRHDSENPP